jgi:hypothetical protein
LKRAQKAIKAAVRSLEMYNPAINLPAIGRSRKWGGADGRILRVNGRRNAFG